MNDTDLSNIDWNNSNLLIGDERSKFVSSASLTISPYQTKFSKAFEEAAKNSSLEAIKGKHSFVIFRLERDLGARSQHSIEFYFDVVSALDAATEREKLAYWLSTELPQFPENKTVVTPDQARYWVRHKDWMIYIAQIFCGHWDNPVALDKEAGLLSQIEHDLIWSYAKLYLNLWELISLKWKPLSIAIKRAWGCPFSSPQELFQEVVSTEINEEFRRCFERHYIMSCKEYKKFLSVERQAFRGGFLTQPEQEERERLRSKYVGQNVWWNRILDIFEDVSARKVDPIVEAHLKTNNAYIDAICQFRQRAICSGQLKSATWRNGSWLSGVHSIRQLERRRYFTKNSL